MRSSNLSYKPLIPDTKSPEELQLVKRLTDMFDKDVFDKKPVYKGFLVMHIM